MNDGWNLVEAFSETVGGQKMKLQIFERIQDEKKLWYTSKLLHIKGVVKRQLKSS